TRYAAVALLALASVGVSVAQARDWEARHGLTSAEFQAVYNDLTPKDYRPIWISGYAVGGETRYAGIWVKGGKGTWEARHDLSTAQYQKTVDKLKAKGYRVSRVSGYTVGGKERYAAVWVKGGKKKKGGAWEARHGLSNEKYQKVVDKLVGKG